MSYKRRFLRFLKKEQSMDISRTGQSRLLPQLLLTAVLAGGFVMQPLTAWASTITKADSAKSGTIVQNGTVYNIYADRLVNGNQTALNVFETYSLDAGHIANMHFRTQGDATNATNLVNFVNSRIDINGTVNAVQNSQIGGNLYFLSKEGMAVGSSGVINTGALYVATPTKDSYENYRDKFDSYIDSILFNSASTSTGFTAIPVNASGTITVLGKINTTGDTYLRSAKIGVGKNVSDKEVYGTAADKTVANASIQTGITDFSSFVKLTSEQQDAMNGIELKAAQVGNGDIVLTAIATERNTKDASFTSSYTDYNTIAAEIAVSGKKDQDIIKAAGAVNITATASSGENYSIYFDQSGTTDNIALCAGDIVQTKAVITIDSGKITGQQLDIAAKSVNNFISSDENGKALGSDVLSYFETVLQWAGLNMGASYAVLDSTAAVTIGQDAVLTATAAPTDTAANALSITADSTVKASAGATTAGYRLMTLLTTAVPTAAAAYASANSSAEISVKGALSSAGNTKVAATSNNTLEVTATAASSDVLLSGDTNYTELAFGVAVANGSNSSKVEFADSSSIDVKGALSINAASISSVNTKAKGKALEKAIATTAINVTSFDSAAEVILDGSLTATSIAADAANTLTKNSVESDSELDSSGFKTGLKGAWKQSTLGSEVMSGISSIFGQLQGKLGSATQNTQVDQALKNLGSKIGLGVSVAVATESNSAQLTVKNTAKLTATDSLSLTATNIIQDTYMTARGSTDNDYSEKQGMVSAGVLVASMNNSAAVTVEGGKSEEGKHTQLTAKDITINATSEFQYNRVNAIIKGLQDTVTGIWDAIKMSGVATNSNDSSDSSGNSTGKNSTTYGIKTSQENTKDKEYVDALITAAEKLETAVTTFKDNKSTYEAKNSGSAYIDTDAGQKEAQNISELTDKLNTALKNIQSAAEKTTTATASAEANAPASVQDVWNGARKVWSNLSDIVNGPYNIISAITDFADMSNYANFSASSSVGGVVGMGTKSNFGAAGSVAVSNVGNNASVLIGQNSVLNATGKVAVSSTLEHTAVTSAGKLGFDSGAKTIIGASVSVHTGDLNSAVIIGQGAKLTGSAINLAATNNSTEVGLVISGGAAEKNDVSGMVSYMGGTSNSVVAVDDEAVLTANRAEADVEEEKNDGSITIHAANETVITNIAGGLVTGMQAAIGASVGITSYTVNALAAVADIDIGASRSNTDAASGLLSIVHKATGLSDEENKELLGESSDTTTGGITAHSVSATTANDSVINTVTVTGSVITANDSSQTGLLTKYGDLVQTINNNAINATSGLIDKIGGIGMREKLPSVVKSTNAYEGQALPSFTFAGSGSASVNLVKVNTQSVLDGAKITLTDAKVSSVNVNATDSSFIGAWGGAAAISWKTCSSPANQSGNTAGIAGAIAYNDSDSSVTSLIENSSIKNAASLTNTALKDGAIVSAGLGLAAAATGAGEGKTFEGAASVSVNLVDNDIYAYLENNEVSSTGATTTLTNTASSKDTQITGGVNTSLVLGGSKSVALGGTVNYAGLDNDIQAKISSGKYTNIGTAENLALTDLTQVSTAVGVSVAASAKSNYGFEGVVAYTDLNNATSATVEENAALQVESLKVAAYDAYLGEKQWESYISDRQLDATGSQYIANVNNTTGDNDELKNIQQQGNTVVTAALGVTTATGTDSNVTGVAAIAISNIDNDFTAKITGSEITASSTAAEAVHTYAKTDTLLVGIGAGVAVSAGTEGTSFGGAGSVTWNTMDNDTTATIENSTIKAADIKANVDNTSLLVNVAGQVSVSKLAMGLAIAYNSLENVTSAYILGSTLSGVENNDTVNVTLDAANEGKAYAIGAGVGVSIKTAAANGTIAINQGHNDTEAVIDEYSDSNKKTTITNAKEVTVTAADKTSLFALAGGVGAGKGAAVGGAVAYNEVGGLNTDSSARKQNTTAGINNTEITTATAANVKAAASDASKLTTISVGVGVTAGSAAVEGAASAAFINKNVEASLESTTISNGTADVEVSADTDSSITTNATVLAVGLDSGAAIGAGISVNRITQDTVVTLNKTDLNIAGLLAQSQAYADITNIGVGGSVVLGGAGVSGSVAVNLIDNDTTATLADSTVTVEKSAVVVAGSDEKIANYAGLLSVDAGSGAAVGLSVSVNKITGTTGAYLKDAAVTANAKGSSISLNDTVADTALPGKVVTDETLDSTLALADSRSASSYNSGIIVSSSATHTLKAALFNVGAAYSGAVVTGTVNVNYLSGTTEAALTGSKPVQSAGTVQVIAHDYTSAAGLVGSLDMTGEGAAVGLGSDTNTLSQTTTASLSGSSATEQAQVSGQDIAVQAVSKQGISSLTGGLTITAAGAAVNSAVSVALLDGTTKALLSNAQINAATLDVQASHTGRLHTLAFAVGGSSIAGVGLGVGVLKEESETTATVDNTVVSYGGNAKGKTSISAANTTEAATNLYNFGGAAAGIAGSVGVNNLQSKVAATVSASTLGSEDGAKAGAVEISASNTINLDAGLGAYGGGGVGVGVGVAVNTIDSQVRTDISSSKLYATGAVAVIAEEERTVSQLATNASLGGTAAGSVNVMVTNVGKALSDTYATENSGTANLDAMLDEADAAIAQNKLTSAYEGLEDLGLDNSIAKANSTVGRGTDNASQVKVNVADDAVLNTAAALDISATESTSVTMKGITASGSTIAAASGTFGITNVHRNTGVDITSAQLTGSAVNITTALQGASELKIYQGTAALNGAIGAAYASLHSSGNAAIDLESALINASGSLAINAADNSTGTVEAIGVAEALGVAASVLVAEGINETAVTVDLSGSQLTAAEDVTIGAEREGKSSKGNTINTLTVTTTAAAGGLSFAGTGVGATAKEAGTVGITLDGSTAAKSNVLAAGRNLSLEAYHAPNLSAATTAAAGSYAASAAVTVAHTYFGDQDDHASTYVRVQGANNRLAAGVATVDGSATNGCITAAAIANPTLTTDMTGISLGVYATVGVNTGGAAAYSDVEVSLDDGITYDSTADAEDTGITAANLDIDAYNTVTQKVAASGLQLGGFLATGTNLGSNEAVLNTTVTANGSSNASRLQDVAFNSASYAEVNNAVAGAGGSLVTISPYAAKASSAYTADTKITLAGSWQTDGSFSAYAVNGGALNVAADGSTAAILNGSGTWLRNTLANTAQVQLQQAAVTSGGAQLYLAENQVDYTGKLEGSGFGALSVNAADYGESIKLNAQVDIDGATLTGTGDSASITALAATGGTINSSNYLYAAGVIPVALAYSEHAIEYNNDITVGKDSSLLTEAVDQDITLAAVDQTKVKLSTIANNQGGLAGTATSVVTNSLSRSNTINVEEGATIQSAHDVNLYGGADENGASSSLALELYADAYNKSFIPFTTTPRLENALSQSNQVIVAGTVYSIHNINLYGAKGSTTVSISNSKNTIWTGLKDNTTVTSTEKGETAADETTDNYVTVSGVVKAGIHNELQLTISGTTQYVAPTYDSDGKQLTEGYYVLDDPETGIRLSVNDTADWFEPDGIKIVVLSLPNSLLERYNTIKETMGKYAADSSAYASYKAELNALLLEMKNLGMVEEHSETVDGKTSTTYIPVENIEVLGISLPDILISGGQVNITADKLSGDGQLTAQAAKELSITNSSDMYLYINALTVQDTGGLVRLNDVILEKAAAGTANTANSAQSAYSFTGAITADGTAEVPEIVVASTSPVYDDAENVQRQPDIGILGNITNTSGDVSISSENYNILVSGAVSARNISIAATNGSVTQTNTSGVINVGGDPLTQFQFSEEVAKKIQEYLNDYVANCSEEELAKGLVFANYDAYKKWLLEVVKIDEALLTTTTVEGAGIQAGGSVYINGLYVNIGGLIQSGYSSYSTTLTEEDAAKVAELDTKWESSKVSLSDNDVLGNAAYLINDGGAYYDADLAQYAYEVKVYYNPCTQQLLTEALTPTGGKVYISGYITSTDNGRIIAADGAPSISIDTSKVLKDVTVNAITSSSISGFISISDNFTKTVTEYMNGKARSYAMGTDSASVAWGEASSVYKTQENAQYVWTGGSTATKINNYSYTKDFLFWGWLKYDQTDTFVASITDKENIKVAPVSSAEGNVNTEDFFLINANGDSSNPYLTISLNKSDTKEQEKYTDVVATKHYAGITGKIFGYGDITYSWSGTFDESISTSTHLRADKEIAVGFTAAAENAGRIAITSAQDMFLAGNITNPTVAAADGYVGQGTTNLTSTGGSIATVGNSRIISDSVIISAADDISVNHAAIGSSATLDITSSGGDISFISDKGDLLLTQVRTNYDADAADTVGAITATTGNVYLEAEGSILAAATESTAVVQGKRLDLVSNNGSIGSKTNALLVQAGTDTYSGDSMAASINATAAQDIVLTQAVGDMRLGIIQSTNGDAVLTVTDGSFVDAYSDSSTEAQVDTQAKIQQWLAAGLISADDSDGSSDSASEEAYKLRVSGLEARAKSLAAEALGVAYSEDNADITAKVAEYKAAADAEEVQALRNTYVAAVQEAAGDAEAISTAYAEYQAALEAYFTTTSYSTAEQELIAAFMELGTSYEKVSSNYGYSKNQLLYAIQDSILNSEPGTTPSIATQANVSAQNITLVALDGGVGVDGAAEVISYAELAEGEKLELLATAQAGDLTWSTDAEGNAVSDGQYVTVSKQNAVDVQLLSETGVLTATGTDNVYLSSVEEAQLTVDQISSDGNVKLVGDAGISALDSGSLVNGANLTIYGGSGSIGSATQALSVSIDGTLYANSTEGVYITQTEEKTLVVQAIATEGDVLLTANKGMSMDTSTTAGYISSTEGTITLISAAGSVGCADENAAMRIHNNGAAVTVIADDSIYLQGKNSSGSSENGTLMLESITAADTVYITSEGSIKLNEANGASVVLQSGIDANDNYLQVQRLTAGSSVILNGAHITIDALEQRQGADAVLKLTVSGTGGTHPADSVIISSTAGLDNGVVLERLWADNINIRLQTPSLEINELFVNNVASVSNASTSAIVWGSTSQHNGAAWLNNGLQQPCAIWQQPQNWMYLQLTEQSAQYSNGLLLLSGQGIEGDGKSFTAADRLGYLTSKRLQDVYDWQYEPGIAYFYRYYLYELPEDVPGAGNAAPEQLQLEE